MNDQKFWDNMDRSGGEASCWPWLRHRLPTGYGHVADRGKMVRTHRRAWALTNGPIPAGLYVCHRCDNPPCCNPAHLWLGTAHENMRDASAKKRFPDRTGPKNSRAKLSESNVLELRRMCADGATVASAARRFGVGWTQAKRVVDGENWVR